MFRLELAELEAGTAIPQLVAQHPQGAEGAQLAIGGVGIGLLQLAGNPFKKMLFRVVRIKVAILLPLLVLRFLNKTEHVLFVERQFAVVSGRRAQPPAVGDHLIDDVVLEDLFD